MCDARINACLRPRVTLTDAAYSDVTRRMPLYRDTCIKRQANSRFSLFKSQIPLRYLVRTSFEPDGVMEFGFYCSTENPAHFVNIYRQQ